MVPPSSRGISRVPRYSNNRSYPFRLRGFHPLWRSFPTPSARNTYGWKHRQGRHFGLFRFRSPLLAESRLISFPGGTEMFHFPPFALPVLCIQTGVVRMNPTGLPHSGISGSKPVCGSPKLIAACHALHRLQMPRHPPCALSNLTDGNQIRKTFEKVNRLSNPSQLNVTTTRPALATRRTSINANTQHTPSNKEDTLKNALLHLLVKESHPPVRT